MKRLDVPARGPKTLPRPVDCTSPLCASNVQELKRETVKMLHHVEHLEGLLSDKAAVTSDHLDLAKHIRGEYMSLGKTPNESQIKILSKRLNQERGGMDVEEDVDVLADDPFLPAEPNAPYAPTSLPGHIYLDSGSDIDEPALAKEPDPQQPPNSPPPLEDVEDSDSDGSDSDVLMDDLEQAILAMDAEPDHPSQYASTLEPPQNPPGYNPASAAADSPSPPSSPLSDTGLGDSD